MPKITFAIIILNGDFVLHELLTSIYPYAHKIVVSEGSVGYWKEKGITTSTDQTNDILHSFPDPENKLHVVHGTYKEKTELCRAFMPFVPNDTDYLWCIDSDEIFKDKDIEKVIQFLKERKPSTVGFQSNTFFGGLERTLTGFEKNHSFRRLLKYHPDCIYNTHRPPTLTLDGKELNGDHVKGRELFQLTGVEMYHYSYVFPRQVREKIEYYENAVIKKGHCIPNYYEDVWLRWVLGDESQKKEVEDKYNGVHEFSPNVRGECRTQVFNGTHPKVIQDNIEAIKQKITIQTN